MQIYIKISLLLVRFNNGLLITYQADCGGSGNASALTVTFPHAFTTTNYATLPTCKVGSSYAIGVKDAEKTMATCSFYYGNRLGPLVVIGY